MGANHSHRPIAMEGLSLSSIPFSTVNLTLSTGRSLLEVFLIISLMRSSRPTSSSMEISKTALFWKTRGQGSRGDLGSWLTEPCHLWNMLCNWRISTLSRANGLIANELSQRVRSQKTKRHWLLKSRRVCNHLALNSKWPLASKLILALLKTCIRIRSNNLTLSEQHPNPYPQGPQAKQGIFNAILIPQSVPANESSSFYAVLTVTPVVLATWDVPWRYECTVPIAVAVLAIGIANEQQNGSLDFKPTSEQRLCSSNSIPR